MAVIGIDLGTTNSAVAIIKNDKPEIIPNKDGHRTTPSIFVWDLDPKIVIGQQAKDMMIGLPDRAVMEVKRLMGTTETLIVGDKEYRPEEISAQILRYLKDCAEDQLGEAVTEAVITVPAYFSDAQRKATQRAGELAGMKVERIINEPTAAAIAYRLENIDKNQNILVYDLGGGTFDVSIVEIFEGIVEVKASAGDNHLGGADFDNVLFDWIMTNFEKQNGINLLQIGTPDEINQRRLRIKLEAEQVKKNLSSQNTASINIPFIAFHNNAPLSINMTITREEFEALIIDMARKTLVEIDKAIGDARLSVSDIDEIILIGGSTRIPLIQQLVEEKFGKKLMKDINPDEAVALGAAIQAGIKSGQIDTSKSLMVVDVCPYTLGTDVVRNIGGQNVPGFFDPIIPRNSSIPITESKIYTTVHDNQTGMNVTVYQGDNPYSNQNEYLGEILIEGIPAAPATRESVEVTFAYDINGTLQVEVKVVSTGKKVSGTIQTKTGMSDLEILEAKHRIEQDWEQSELAEGVKSILARAERMLFDVNGAEKERLNTTIQSMKAALSKNDKALVEKYEEELTDLLIELV